MNTHLITANDLHLSLQIGDQGIGLHAVTDKKSGRRFLRDANASLFTLTARACGEERFVSADSKDGWNTVGITVCGNIHTLTFAEHELLTDVTVILTAVAARDRVTWTVRLHSENEQYTLYECDYPALSFGTCSRTKVFFPYGCGEVYPAVRTFKSQQNYPSYGASMQYMALWHTGAGRGLYYGLHDPAPAYKKLFYQKEEGNPAACIKAIMPLRDIDMPCNSQTLEGETVWELFDGDWYDAALLYKAFFEARASWKPAFADGKRADLPEWLRTNPHWWRKRMKWDESFADELIDVSKDLGLHSPVHLYDWFQIPYDTNYPHYFPAKDAFIPAMRRLQANGNRVMPYINGRLWDTHDKGKEDWQFTPIARPNCTKKIGDKPFLEVYPTSNIELAIMCPSTALWQEKQKEIMHTLFHEFGVDAIYIDQIGAAQAYPCEDRNHAHRAGGGTWWVESYRNLLDHARQTMPKDACLTTECTSDPYMKDIHAYLSWIWIKNDQVPAFMVIYNGYVAVFGRNYLYAPDAVGQDILAAQSLTYGEQMGWILPETYNALVHKEFYKSCVRTRAALGSFFYDGKLLRSPKIEDKQVIKTTKIKAEAYGGLLAHTAAFSEHWERKDGKQVLFLINASAKETSPTVHACIPDGTYRTEGDLQTDVTVQDGALSVTLPPLSVSYLIL
ncbi:MAG: alpha amylase C-terminal domain-containing protein [Clostridia bacterium]|nr:alpha amylase C-terminal domain-containing protein [Clostridia bacterium]